MYETSLNILASTMECQMTSLNANLLGESKSMDQNKGIEGFFMDETLNSSTLVSPITLVGL